jgi:superfamily II DNA/RNA helicase
MSLSSARPPFADPATFPSILDDATGPGAVDATGPGAGFDALGVAKPLVRVLAKEGITTPFPIQSATIPDALAGRDVLGRGRTGSGKTLAFGLPMLTRVAAAGKSAPGRPRGLVLVPTRELAMQVNDALLALARSIGLYSRTAVGGTSYDNQIRDLRRGVDILVATPGRLADLIERRECSLDDVLISVLDEADQMADMGFLPDVTALLAQTPATTQRLLFSATLDNDVDALISKFMIDPVTHEVDPATATVSTMEHHLLLIPPREKLAIITSIAAREGRTLLFVRTQLAVDRLAGQLAEVGVRAGALHGGKTQAVRTRTLAQFREGRIPVLVATDVAARGIHVDDVSLVVHVDPPKDAKDYLHRAGRTARAGESGTVVTLVLPRQRAATFSLLEKAGVQAGRTQVRPGSPELAALTGAREPSGVPVPPDEPERKPRRGGGRPPYGDRPAGRDRRPGTGRPDWQRDRDDHGRRERTDGQPYRQDQNGRPPRTEHSGRPEHGRPEYGRPEHGRPELGRRHESRGDRQRPRDHQSRPRHDRSPA